MVQLGKLNVVGVVCDVPNLESILFQEGGDKFPADANGKLLFSDVDFVETWLEMEKAQKEGLVRSLGVSNFNKDQIERILKEGEIVPVTNQV